MMEKKNITVDVRVRAPVERVWEIWTIPEDVMQWNNASPDWHTPRAQSDLRTGGTFNYRMEAKDGSAGFDFGGTYTDVVPLKRIAYTIGDGRTVTVSFTREGDETLIVETFEAEAQNPLEMQRQGWQSILMNFKTYVETH